MKIKNLNLNLEMLAGVGTWAAVFGISLYVLFKSPDIRINADMVVLGFIGYLLCFLTSDDGKFTGAQRKIGYLIYAAQLFFAFLILWYLPLDFLPILTIIWVANLPRFFSARQSILIMLLVVISWFSVYAIHWNRDVFFQGILYSTFHFFAILMTLQTKKAEEASIDALRLNKELLATQDLLAQASRQNERTRIARDLHDLLGHHLTALIINLQVAGHLTDGEAKSKVEQCHSLAKLLLSDVREAVSAIRENHNLDFHKMVDLMIDNIPNLKVTSNIDTQLDLEELELAKALLSCIQEAITNSLRHSGASEFWITMKQQENNLKLELVDNGQLKGQLIQGNGLSGMKERVKEFDGELTFDSVQNAMRINISIPLLSAGREV